MIAHAKDRKLLEDYLAGRDTKVTRQQELALELDELI